jgi:diguanylate cyclase
MSTLAFIAAWVLGSVCVGLVAGYYLGRIRPAQTQGQKTLDRERRAMVKALVELLKTAERMTSDVECHNTEIQQTADHVGNLDANGEMGRVKQALLGHMEALLSSNHQLQKDLTYSRCEMEEQAQEIDHARREARTDTLTKVANRKAFDEKLQLLMGNWEREGHSFVLLLIDLDYFKRINDTHGHRAGDRVLARVGDSLRNWVREGDFVGRYGGDEFAILLPHTDMEAGIQLAEKIGYRAASRASLVAVRGEEVSISFSIGVAAPRPGDTAESILERADRGLYKSKRLGRNRVQAEEFGEQAETAASGQTDDGFY